MAVTITDNRTLVDGADSTTGWSSPTHSEALNLFTADPDPVEASGCIGMAVGEEAADLVHTISSSDLSDTLVYVWVQPNGTMDTLTNGGVGIVLGDGTDEIAYHVAGSDVAGFRHSTGPVGWQCCIIDTTSLPSSFTTLAGSETNLTLTAITQVGSYFETLSKALGGASNCFTDIIRYGTGGLTITAGTSGDPGQFEEIATADRANTNEAGAYGVLRELGTGLFGCQGPLTFGDTAGTTATFFADSNVTVAFEDRGLASNRYSITVQGNSTGSTTFRLGTLVGSENGTAGCTFLIPSGLGGTFTATDTDLQFLQLYGSSISGFENGITLSTDATNAPNHDVFDCAFSGNGEIAPGLVDFRNNAVSGAVLANNLEAAVLLPTSTTNFQNTAFQIGTEGHAITVESGTSYTITGATYTGYSASSGATFHTIDDVEPSTDILTTDAAHGFVTEEPVILNDDGGTDTIGLTEGTTYYVNAQSTTTLSFHATASAALGDTGRIALTDGSTGETQSLYSGNAALLNNTGGALTITVSGGNSPSYRNVGSSTTTVSNSVEVTLTGLINPTEVRVYSQGTTTELNGQEDVTTGSFAFSQPAASVVDIRIFAVSYEPADLLGFTIPDDPASIPIQQRFDRNYENP